MITIYKTGELGLEIMDEIVKGCWISVVDPTPDELAQALKAAASFKPYQPAELTSLLERGKPMAAQWGPVRGPVA